MTNLEIAQKAFEKIRTRFPQISMQIYTKEPFVLSMKISKQDSLAFDMQLHCESDELYLSAGIFWIECFPCTDPKVVEKYIDAASGLLSGKYRILEYYYAGKPMKAKLQAPTGDGWKTIGTWAKFGLYLPWGRTTKVLQNNPQG